jgi:hypothetical protein
MLRKSKEGEKLLPLRPGQMPFTRACNLRQPPDTQMAAQLQEAFRAG